MSKNLFEIKITGMENIEKAFKQYQTKVLDKDIKKIVSTLAKALYSSVKKNTPVDTGSLRRSWEMSKVQVSSAGDYSVVLYNTMEYAIYVEYGHRTKGNGWVEGQFFAQKSLEDLKNMSKKDMEQFILKSIKKELQKRGK